MTPSHECGYWLLKRGQELFGTNERMLTVSSTGDEMSMIEATWRTVSEIQLVAWASNFGCYVADSRRFVVF